MTQTHQMLLKIVFTGDSGVGKTSLLRREAEGAFTQQHLATIGVDFRIKQFQVGKIAAKVQMWDTAGQERFRSIQKPYYKNSHAICLCFSLNDRKTFDNLGHWLNEVRNFDVQGQIYLIGCKSDVDIEVPTDEILIFAEGHGVIYLQTSAKDNVGVHEAFCKIVEDAVQSNLIKMAFNPKQEDLPKVQMMLQKPKQKNRSCFGC